MINLPSDIEKILRLLNTAGFKAYAVGGCVRDSFMGKEPNDWDITTDAKPEQIQEVFSDCHLNLKGLKHGTVGVIKYGTMTEVTTYRIDGSYTDSRRPDNVTFTDKLSEDLSRRDFTVNAMAMDINENIVDVFNGRQDLKKRIIRTVGDAKTRFNEDALRIMRGLRFASKEGFSLEEDTLNACNELAFKLKSIAYERIYIELKKMLALKNAPAIMARSLPVFKSVFPTLNEKKWQKICSGVKKSCCDTELSLAVILLEADTEAELLRLKTEASLRKKILKLKELLLGKIKNQPEFLQLLMCEHSKEDVLFLCKYLSLEGESYNENALAALKGITSVKELEISGDEIKKAGFKSYKIKETLKILLEAVVMKRCKNNIEDLKKYLAKIKASD
jgi:tRNA nucleotidyltransferase/poly(A) polymerase